MKNRMRAILLLVLSFFLISCQIPYLIESSYHQTRLLKARQPIDTVLSNPQMDPDTRRKLILSKHAKAFAESKLGLESTDNYDTFVELNRDYVTWIVRAAPQYKLEHYLWWFPIVGHVPYKGFFDIEDAKEEARDLKEMNYDTYVRGVSAYSTLGWFDDPLLSSMLKYDDHDLINVIIHESVHATIYIANASDFNERLATFIGNKGTELFYLEKEGKDSETLQVIKDVNFDNELFSEFISEELNQLRDWYSSPPKQLTPDLKTERLKAIQVRFEKSVVPKLKTDRYKGFSNLELNNALLMGYETYQMDLDDFEKAFTILDNDFSRLIQFCKELEGVENPEKRLKEFVDRS